MASEKAEAETTAASPAGAPEETPEERATEQASEPPQASAEAGPAGEAGAASDAADREAPTGVAATSAATGAASPRADAPEAARPTAGQRLAAARAAKAARKAAQRGRTAEVVETRAEQRAAEIGGWLRQRTKLLLGVAGGLLALVLAAAIFGSYRERAAAEASDSLWKAVETARAPLADDPGLDPAAPGETFADAATRAERALEGFEAVVAAHGGTPAATWASLGAGASALTLGRTGDARAHFERALESGGDDPVVAWRALEGLVLTYEAEQKWDEALARLEELRTADDGAFAEVADYHAARMRLAKGEREEARAALETLVEGLRGAGPDLAEGSGRLPYVRREAERLLDALGGAKGAAGAEEGIRRALEQLRTDTAGGAGAE